MKRIQELLSEEDVQKLKSVPKRRSLHKKEIVRELMAFGVKVSDTGRAREVLGWAPVVGLRETIRYFEKPIRGSY